ncbi:MAG: CehA/McbA family metallohydrolase [Gemmatales bacterium]
MVKDQPVTISYQVKRWIDPSKDGWWSGDHHIHAAGCAHYEKPTEGVHPPDMMRHCLGEDLKVGCCLTWGPCFDYQKRFFSGRPDPVSKMPYLLRYDVEVSGFGSHQSGHLCLLRLKEQMYPGRDSKNHWPTLGLNTLRWAKKQGAIVGPAHSGNGLTDSVGRVAGGQDGPHQLPNFRLPSYNGIGANEYIVDITHDVPGPDGKLVPAVDFISAMDTNRVAEWNMWYHSLNAGFRVKVSGETDFPCIYGQRVGIGRVYCKLKGQPNYDEWCQAIGDGQCYVSDGTTHLMDFQATAPQKVEMGVGGSELKLDKPGSVTFTVKAASNTHGARSFKPVPGITLAEPKNTVELIVNGYVAATGTVYRHGDMETLTFKDVNIDKSSWVAVRVFPNAHTNPIFVIVDNKPIRPSKASVEWCLKGVDQCWKEKKRTYKQDELAEAEAAYEHARKVYQQRLAECVE